MKKYDDSLKLGKNVDIQENVTIGKDVIIHNNVTIYPNTVIGDRVEIFENAVIGKPPRAPKKSIVREIRDEREYKPCIIGDGCVIGPNAVLYSQTELGKEVLIGDSCSIREECYVGDNCLISRCVTVNYNTTIGARTKIMDCSHITGNMIVEEDVFISTGVVSTNDNDMGGHGYNEEETKGPHIKRFAKIGANVAFLPKVVVGEYAVVGTGSVVTKDIPSRKVAMGIPARVVRDI